MPIDSLDRPAQQSRWNVKYSPIQVLLAVTAVWLGSVVMVRLLAGTWIAAGQVGDTFGAVNALFSGLAFCGVVLALGLQQEELALQRQELTETRVELSRTASAQEQTTTLLARQTKILATTARVAALTSLIENYQTLIDATPRASRQLELQDSRTTLIQRLESILSSVEDAS